jgi:transcriptional regulator with XRE-family HTH domain
MIPPMNDTEALYQFVGRNIRRARELSAKRLSQEKLASKLGISRASIVNIEAGRQHAPLHVLWRVAEILDTDFALLVPRRDELHSTDSPIQLDGLTNRKIERVAKGDADMQKSLASLIGWLKTNIESAPVAKDTP